ncbi:MAG: AAA family ATPase [Alphaproteobacteria bacterium]|nr:AAA family ATPase [Alphaproteobacteria bacterium]
MGAGFEISNNVEKTLFQREIEVLYGKKENPAKVAELLCDYFLKYYKEDEDVEFAVKYFKKIYKKYDEDELPVRFFLEFARLYINTLRHHASVMTGAEVADLCQNALSLLEYAKSRDPKSRTLFLYLARFYRLNLDTEIFRKVDAQKMAEQYFNLAISYGSEKAAEEYKTFVSTNKVSTSFDFLNANKNLVKISDAVLNNIETNNFSMLLYGPEGSGKDSFVQYLRQKISEHYQEKNKTADICTITPLNFEDSFFKIKPTAHLIIIRDEFGVLLKDMKRCYTIAEKVKAQIQNVVLIVNDIDTLPKDFITNFLFKIKFGYMNEEQEEAAYELFFDNPPPQELNTISGLVIDDFSRIKKQAHYLHINDNTEIMRLIKDELKLKFGGHEYQKPLTTFDSKLVNCDTDIDALVERLRYYDKENPFSMLIYGPPGTGKSYFLRYLAQTIGINTVEKKPAELFSKYQGQPAKNVLTMFEEAEEKDAMLIIDEVEGIISERGKDNNENKWKSDMTNTFLSSMESCRVPFAGTSNHLKRIDKAILRRFVFKLHFDYLTPSQARYAFEKIFGLMAPWELSEMQHLTSGDFSVVKKKALILGCLNDVTQLCRMLKEELENKEA